MEYPIIYMEYPLVYMEYPIVFKQKVFKKQRNL